jgi:Asp-tRNA(Asn)/Glu-tRNA(Gln) amidotransferase A subunit family amidase
MLCWCLGQVNCVTELLPELALERAAYLDSLDEPLGPLHGLPISIKEHHGMFGRMKTCGFVAFIEADSVCYLRLWERGRLSIDELPDGLTK